MTGAELLDRLSAALGRYVVMPDDASHDAVVLWIAATHAQPAWTSATRLVIKSPERRCGKSRLLDVIEATVHRPFMAFNATVAAVVRSIDDDDPPTLLLDEADAIWPSSGGSGGSAENLRALLNAGFGRGRPIVRCAGSGANQEVVRLPSFAMAALAGIGDTIPDTVTDRAVVVRMRRRTDAEPVAPFRARRDATALHEIRNELSAWISTVVDDLADAEPTLPVTDRAAGGHWPDRARHICAEIVERSTADEAEAGRAEHMILSAIRDVFATMTAGRITSEQLITDLAALGHSTEPVALATALRPYEIRPRNIKLPGGAVRKGYLRSDFTDAWDRYLLTV